MSHEIRVHLLPSLAAPEEFQDGIAVVIDLLRASTTIVHALAAGVKAIVPCQEVAEARRRAAEFPEGQVLLGGERGGELIEGFHLDNSPLRYLPEVVQGKTVVFTTTNGTRALHRAAGAKHILIGSFVNLAATVHALMELRRERKRTVHLVCAGTDGRVTAEDVFCAGAVVAEFRAAVMKGGEDEPLIDCDSAQLALAYWRAGKTHPEGILWSIRESLGGRNLIELGHDADIERAAQLNLFSLVPEYLPLKREIVARC